MADNVRIKLIDSADAREGSDDRSCSECGASSPRNGSYTLISTQGWRLKRRSGASHTLCWYCPSCWSKHRQK